MLQVVIESGQEGRIPARLVVGRSQFLQGTDQGFGDEPAAEPAEMTAGIGEGMEIGGAGFGHGRRWERGFRSAELSAHMRTQKSIISVFLVR